MALYEGIDMSENNVKASTTVGVLGSAATVGTAASTASAVVGGSAATIMSATFCALILDYTSLLRAYWFIRQK